MHFLPHHPFSTYFPPLVLYFKQFLRGHGCFCGVFLYLFFFLSYQRNALRAQRYSCPLPLFFFHTIFPVTVWAPLQCCFWTWWLMKQPSLNHWLWASGCGWWAVEGYHVRGITIQKRFLLIRVSSWRSSPHMALQIHQQPYLMSFWFKMTEFLGAVFLHRILFGGIRMICALIGLSVELCTTEFLRLFCGIISCRFSHWGINVELHRWHRSNVKSPFNIPMTPFFPQKWNWNILRCKVYQYQKRLLLYLPLQ